MAAAVVDAQRALIEQDWPGGHDVRVRMGLHSGEALLTEDGYTGIDVHRAARIGSAGHGGQILALGDRLRADAGFRVRDLGSHRLAGLPEPEHIHQLLADGLPRDFPPLRNTIAHARERDEGRDRRGLGPPARGRRRACSASRASRSLAQSDNADDLLRHVAMHKPAVAIVDIRMPPTHTDEGLVAAREIRERFPGTGVLVLSQYVEPGYAVGLLEEGAEGVGYLLKDRVSDLEEFAAAVRRVGEGGSALDPAVVSQLVGRRRADDPLDALTPREREVLELMAEGRSNQAIAERMFVTLRAVEKHVTSIFTKLDLPASERRPPPRARRARVPPRLIREAAAAREARRRWSARLSRIRRRCGLPHPKTPDRRTVGADGGASLRGTEQRPSKENSHVTLEAEHQHRGPDGSLEREDTARPRSSAGSRSSSPRSRSAPTVGMKTIDQNDTNVGEARKADHIIRDAGFKLDEQMEYVLVQSPTKTAADPAFRAVVDQAIAKLESFPKVTKLRSPLAKGNEGQISEDGHAVLIQFSPKGSYDEATTYIDTIVAGTAAGAEGEPRLHRRRGRLGVDGQGARRDVRLAARPRRDDLDPDHARHPAARVRLARRRARSRSGSRSPPCSRRWASSPSRARSCRWTSRSPR